MKTFLKVMSATLTATAAAIAVAIAAATPAAGQSVAGQSGTGSYSTGIAPTALANFSSRASAARFAYVRSAFTIASLTKAGASQSAADAINQAVTGGGGAALTNRLASGGITGPNATALVDALTRLGSEQNRDLLNAAIDAFNAIMRSLTPDASGNVLVPTALVGIKSILSAPSR